MPMMKGWYSRRKAPPPPITCLTVAFFVLDWDTRAGNIHWSGFGKYLNYAFRYIAIACAVIYLFGYYLKKWTQLMRPILYVLVFGIVFALTAAACYPLGFDITGNTCCPAQQTVNNSTHTEALNITTTISSNIDASPTGGNSTTIETPEKEFTSVYSFAVVRAFVCLVLWIFHFFNYVDKFNEREAEEENEAASHALS